MTIDEEEGCGYSWDHTLDPVSEQDGVRIYGCRECGAEVIEDES